MRLSISYSGFGPIAPMIAAARAAEHTGLEGIWIAEHVGFHDAVVPSACFLSRTERIEVGVVGPAPAQPVRLGRGSQRARRRRGAPAARHPRTRRRHRARPARRAHEDVTLGGIDIPAGGMVIPIIGAANRDPARFPDPDRFDITRGDQRPVAFGTGMHHCLGAQLARLEAKIVFGALLRLWLRLDLAEAGAKRPPVAGSLRLLESLHVTSAVSFTHPESQRREQ